MPQMPIKLDDKFHAGLYCRTKWDILPSHTQATYESTQVSKFKRPADGEPARHYTVQCEFCDATLSYRLHSASTSRRRRIIWLCLIPVSVLIGLVGLLLIVDFGGQEFDPDREGAMIMEAILYLAMIVVGLGGTMVYTTAARNEFGLSGPGMFYSGPSKHKFTLLDGDHFEARTDR